MMLGPADGSGSGRPHSSGVLIHEWLERAGGSENVLEEMSRIFPEAPIICLWNDAGDRFPRSRVVETWLARTPLRRHKSLALPLMPLAWRTLPPVEAEWALISSHAFAHHAKPEGVGRRYVYVHTPARYVWTPELDTRGRGPAARVAAFMLKPLDRRRAHEGAEFAANSDFVRQRIGKAWDVDARVIHPPVEVTRIQDWDGQQGLNESDRRLLDGLPAEFVLGASRFIPYKRLDLVVAAAESMGLPAILAGAGPEESRLRESAAHSSVPIHFVLHPSTLLLWSLYRRASVYVFPAVEDFGIMPVEALAAGAPVVAQAVGGTSEIVEAGVSGALSRFESRSDIRAAIVEAQATAREDRLKRARVFSRERFDDQISRWVVA